MFIWELLVGQKLLPTLLPLNGNSYSSYKIWSLNLICAAFPVFQTSSFISLVIIHSNIYIYATNVRTIFIFHLVALLCSSHFTYLIVTMLAEWASLGSNHYSCFTTMYQKDGPPKASNPVLMLLHILAALGKLRREKSLKSEAILACPRRPCLIEWMNTRS